MPPQAIDTAATKAKASFGKDVDTAGIKQKAGGLIDQAAGSLFGAGGAKGEAAAAPTPAAEEKPAEPTA